MKIPVLYEKTEVTKQQYNKCRARLNWLVATRREGEKYFIKLMLGSYNDYLMKGLN